MEAHPPTPAQPALRLVTPGGAVAAPWESRAFAAVMDFGVRLLLVLVPAAVGALLHLVGQSAGEVGIGAGLAVGLIASVVYAPVMIARSGQTIGHRRTGTMVVGLHGERIGGGRAALREIVVKAALFETIGVFTFYLLTLADYLWPIWDKRGQALHDKMCRTLVISVPPPA